MSSLVYTPIAKQPSGYVVVAKTASVDEGEWAIFTVNTTNIEWGKSINYTLSGISAADLVSGSLSGTALVAAPSPLTSSNLAEGIATIRVQLKKDGLTEGDETLKLRVGLASADVTVKDTSKYRIEASKTTANEGDSVSFTVYTSNKETSVNYTISGIESADLVSAVPLSGTLNVTPATGTARITLALKQDARTEGMETLVFKVGDDTASVQVNDTSRTVYAAGAGPVSYSIANGLPSSGAASVNEGDLLTFQVTTTNVAWGNSIPYTVTGISASDLDSGALSGTALVSAPLAGKDANPQVLADPAKGVATIRLLLKNDGVKEGPETLTLNVGGATSAVTVNDTSIYRVQASRSAVNEGESVTFTVYTSDNETSVRYTVGGDGIDARDFASAPGATPALTGSLPVTPVGSGPNGVATFTLTLAKDLTTEGIELLNFTVGSGVTSTASVRVNDSSRIDELSAGGASVNEGETAVFLVRTSGIPDGTVLDYTIGGDGIDDADVVGGLTGSTVVVSGGQAVIAIPTVVDYDIENSVMVTGQTSFTGSDGVTETTDITKVMYGTEVMTVTVGGVSASVLIKDWATLPGYNLTPVANGVNEGDEAKFVLKTIGLMPGSAVRYEISGTVDANDYINPWGGSWGIARVSGSLSNGQALISIPIVADRTTENDPVSGLPRPEELTISIGETSATVKINDTSKAPAYTIKATQLSCREGSSAFFNITSSYAEPGSWIDYLISGPGVSAADIGIAMQGRIQLDRLAKATLAVPLVYDRVTEGNELLTVQIVGTAASATVTIVDGP